MKILAIDIGNSRTSIGCFDDRRLLWRDDLNISDVIGDIHRITANRVDVCVISRVSVQAECIETAIQSQMECRILVVNHAESPLEIRYRHPEKLGQDRIANALAAHDFAPEGAIVVDFGTATHFDVVDSEGVFWGGPILLGVESMVSALSQRVPHLPGISLDSEVEVIASSTESAIKAGAILGTAGAVDKIIQMMKTQVEFTPKIIITGGNAALVAPYLTFDVWDPDLTLKGLCQYALLRIQSSLI